MDITRHDFLKVALAGGGLAGAAAQTGSETPGREAERQESDDLLVRVFQNGTFSVAQKAKPDSVWLPDPWEAVACRVTFTRGRSAETQTVEFGKTGTVEIRKTPEGIASTFQGDGVRVSTLLQLERNVLKIAIRKVELPTGALLVTVEYPFRSLYLRSGKDQGYFAVPNREGTLIPSGAVKLGTTRFWSWHDTSHGAGADITDAQPTMPFYGAQKNGAGYTAILETSDDFSLRYLVNSDAIQDFVGAGRQSPYMRIACAWPLWLSQKGALGYERRMRLEFATGLDYVGMAKAYRKEALAQGHLVTLREKQRARPQIERLAGAPYIAYYAGYPHVPPGEPGFDYKYSQLKDVVSDLGSSLGLRRAFVHFWGAYSVQPPGCLPFDTRPGPVEDLKGVVQKCKDQGFLFTLYNDISAQLEETRLWKPELMWNSREGVANGPRWTRTCSSQFIKLASANMPEVVSTLGVEAAYIDCINAGVTRECYNSKHPLTRSQEREARAALYRYVHSLGLIFGGEHTGWWNAAELEYTNGVGIMSAMGLLNCFPVPLYHLVFHDALIPFCHAGDDYAVNQGTAFEDKVLRDILRGIPPMFFINLRDHRSWRSKIRDSYRMMSDTAAAVMYDEMVSYRWMTDDQMVQRSRFASGVEAIVNFDQVEREGLPPKSFRVSGLPRGEQRGAFTPGWV